MTQRFVQGYISMEHVFFWREGLEWLAEVQKYADARGGQKQSLQLVHADFRNGSWRCVFLMTPEVRR